MQRMALITASKSFSSGSSLAGATWDIPQERKKPAATRVLVVDDEPLIRWSMTETLTERGYVVVEAGTAAEAVRVVSAARTPFEVVVLDLRLPDSTDLTLLARLRRDAPESQIIVMTAYETPDVLNQAARLGAYRVVGKPFEMGEIASLVAEASTPRA